MRAINIQWDTDNDDSVKLPNEMELPFGMTDEDEISDYLSDVTGFCHKGFDLIVELDTCPYNDVTDCRYFEVPYDWLMDVLESLDNMNERKGVNLTEFLCNYIWDETEFIYELAKKHDKLLTESKIYEQESLEC